MEPVTLHGNMGKEKGQNYNTDFFYPEDTDDLKIVFDVPDVYFREEGVPMRELGIDREKNGRIGGIRMKGEKDWVYHITLAPGYGDYIDVRTPELDKLFAPLLPAVSVDLLKFL